MKPARLMASFVVFLAGAVLSHAQSAAYTATVKDAEAEVRSGPSTDPKMYATNRLRRGDLVQVVKVRDKDWLEIKPPAGSFSWINSRVVERIGNTQTYNVVCHNDYPVAVRIGSSLVNEMPTVEGPRLVRGTQVVSIGAALPSDEGMWLPIEPPMTEVRFIRAEAVQATKVNEPPTAPSPVAAPGSVSGGGSPPANVAPAPAPGLVPPASPGINLGGSGGSGTTTTSTVSNASVPAGTVPAPPAPPADPNSPQGMLQQAEQMERAGRNVEAETLYTKLAHLVVNKNYDMASMCYNRIHHMKERMTKAIQQGGIAATTMTVNRLSPTPNNFSNPAVDCHVTACPGPNQASYGSANSPAPTLAPQLIGPGVLRVAGCRINNQTIYAFENRGELIMYVTPEAGVNLDGYLGQTVSMFGPMTFCGDLKKNHMRAMQVTPMP